MGMPSNILWHLVIISITLCAFPAQIHTEPTIQSATVQDKRISLLGRDFEYAIFEMEFNEEISIIDNMPCPCFNDTVLSGNVPTCNIPTLPAVVNETGYNITTLQENVPVPMEIGSGDSRIFKISLLPSAENPCPMLVIRMSIELGPVALFVSNREVPAQGNSMWTKPYWGRDSIWLCPTLPWFGYGDYYINVASQVGDETNRFTMFYYIKNAPQCPNAPPPEHSVTEPSDGSWQWLAENIPKFGNISNGEYHYYRYEFPDRCANFSAAIRRLQFAAADVDIYASVSNQYPTQQSYEWNANMDGDDSLVISYCAPTAPWIIYLGITTYLNDSPYALVATRTDSFELRPVHTMGAANVAWNLARGSDLHCGETVYFCDFGGYANCYADGFQCCFPLYFLPPTDEVNPFWPRHSADPIIDTLGRLKYGPYPELLPRKISLALLKSHRTAGADYTSYIDSSVDLTTCELRWASLLVGSASAAPIVTPTRFQRKANPCVNSEFDTISHQIDSYLAAMYDVESQDALTLLHVSLGFAGFSDTFVGCTSLIDSLTKKTTATFSYSNVTTCRYVWGTKEYDDSPCCSAEKAFAQCCVPSDIPHPVVLPTTDIVTPSIQSQCGTSECSSQVVRDYARLLAANSDLQSGCSAVFRRTAGQEILASRVAFISTCREQLLGADLLGSRCKSDSDCRTSFSCNSNGRCNHTEELVLQCLASSMDLNTATFLLQQWGVSLEQEREQVLINEMRDRYMKQTCVGGNAIRYRDHYWYQTDSPFCEDDCKRSGLEPRCLDTDCAVPALCDRASGAECWRIWTFNAQDQNACLQDRYCSWIDCSKSYPDDSAACEAACIATTTPICVRCQNPFSCTSLSPIDSFNQTRCNQGLCTADPAETSPAACAAKGICSILCQVGAGNSTQCSTESECLASGACSDAVVEEAKATLQINTTGACILPFTNADNECSESQVKVPSGCVSSDEANSAACSARGGYWHIQATDAASCISNAGYGCFKVDSGDFTNRSQSECLRCGSETEWRPFYAWKSGAWQPGMMVPLQWVNREWKQTNRIDTAINYPMLRSDVEAAIAADVSVAFLTNALCEFDNVLKTVETIACDCGTNGLRGSCFSDSSSKRQIGVTRVCAGVPNSLNVIPVFMTATADALSQQGIGCILVRVSLIPADQYALAGTSQLTSEIFKQRVSSLYAVVRNNIDGVVGQILSDGVEISFDYGELPQALCIKPLSSISREAQYSRLDFARINSQGNIVIRETKVSEIILEDVTYLCANVSQNGTYFVVATRTDYKDVTPFEGSQRAQSFVGAALYYFVFAFGMSQAFIILKWDRRTLLQRLGLLGIIAAFNLIRGAFFSLNPGALDSQPAARYVFFELPTFLFFSAYSVILFLWTQIIQRTKVLKRKTRFRSERILLAALNVVFYLVFFLFIILFSTLGTERSPCSFSAAQNQARLSANQRNLGIAYQAVIAIICLSLALIFCVQGGRLILMLRGLRRHESASRRQTRFLLTTTAAICTVSFVIRSIIFIVASAGSSIPAIIFVLLEVIPSMTVLWMLKPWNSAPESSKTGSVSMSMSLSSTFIPGTTRRKDIFTQVSTTNSSSVPGSVTTSSSAED